MANNPAFNSALELVEGRGFKVFPCQHLGKKPLTRNGFLDASNDPIQLHKWDREHPGANYAVATGSESGIFVLDIDSDDAEAWWSAKWIGEGATVTTPRGGRHIYYEYDGSDTDLGITNGSIHKSFDTRGNGGYIMLPGSKTSSKVDPSYGDGEYAGSLDDMIPVPSALYELIPEKQVYSRPTDAELDELSKISKPTSRTPQEERAVEGTLGLLDALGTEWSPGAGWHSTGFYVACSLHRMARSPEYSLTEPEARNLYLSRTPRKPGDLVNIWETRWDSARKQTDGQVAEPLSDVPIRLDASEILDRFLNSSTERLFWESKNIGDVKDLIRELRDAGANKQESYSVSYDCAAMKKLRQKNPDHSSSTWGYVKSIYEVPDVPVKDSLNAVVDYAIEGWSLLAPDERELVRSYPNFIDRYILTAQSVFAEPNMPLHYVNAWIALSCIVGDRADIILEDGRVPLSLWGMPLAKSAAGKGDAKKFMINIIDSCRRGGYGDVNAGGDASAEGMTAFISERPGRAVFFNKDESGALLHEMRREGWQMKFMSLALDLYDGKSNGSLRVGNAKEGVGDSVKTVFNMWLQTTWKNALNALDTSDMESGFVGRFLVAIGDEPMINRESLKPRLASEYQVSLGGVHPAIKSIGEGLNAVVGHVRNIVIVADDEVLDRFVDAREAVREHIKDHAQVGDLEGVMLRVTNNMLKAAALLAVSEGRSKIEVPDLLLALKSGQYWVRDAIRLAEAIGTSEYRRKVDAIISYCSSSPKTKQQIYKSPQFKNEDRRKVDEWIERAEAEGAIARAQKTGKYTNAEH